ncbi:MAG: hypothetical protein L7V85_01465 [Bacteroidia bacterium]|nr:hypothetical protein [Bacteroidia bacterium]
MNKNIVTPEMKRDQKKFLNETKKMFNEMKVEFRSSVKSRNKIPNRKAYIQDLMTLRIRMELYKTTSPSYHTSPNYKGLRKCIVNTMNRQRVNYRTRNNTN